MIINDIKLIKKNIYNITFSNNFELICNEELIVNNLLRKGKELTLDELNELILSAKTYDYYDKALSYLSKGLKSKNRIYNYLLSKEATNEQALDVIDLLSKKKLLDDYKYFENLSDYYLRQLYGPFYIKMKGESEKIDSNIINDIIDNINEESLKNNISVLIKKYLNTKHIDDKNKLKYKLKTYLYQRGYETDMIIKEVEGYFYENR